MSSPSFISPLIFKSFHPNSLLQNAQKNAFSTCMSTSPTPSSSPTPSPLLRAFLESAKEGNALQSLERAEAAFTRLKARNTTTPLTPKKIITTTNTPHIIAPHLHFDVIIAGGTLGIFYATALQALGWRVAVVERGRLIGRTQEWNISRHELCTLVDNSVINQDQLEHAIVTECRTPGRVGVALRDGQTPCLTVSDVLNVGVSPASLVAFAVDNFKRMGGVVMVLHSLDQACVAPNAVKLVLSVQREQKVAGALGAGGMGVQGDGTLETCIVTTRILVDAMGSFSPIAEQVRGARKPDGVCITVGSCMTGEWKQNESSDIIYSFQPINARRSAQYFWEAFPVQSLENCRTTYMFSYGPCDERRQTLTETLEDYLLNLPHYQGIDLEHMQVNRVLFGFFPSYYRDCPTDIAFDRVFPVGDAAGLQSPISFGGFGCCLRHLSRITGALNEALQQRDDTLLSRSQLQGLQLYSPSLSVTGLFNKALSVQPGQKTAGPWLDEFGINEILWANMVAMEELGEHVQRTFLQDVVTADGLSKTLLAMAISNPQLAIKMTPFLGPTVLLDWSRHYVALILYNFFTPVLSFLREGLGATGILGPKQQFWINRLAEAAEYGCGGDAQHHSRI